MTKTKGAVVYDVPCMIDQLCRPAVQAKLQEMVYLMESAMTDNNYCGFIGQNVTVGLKFTCSDDCEHCGGSPKEEAVRILLRRLVLIGTGNLSDKMTIWTFFTGHGTSSHLEGQARCNRPLHVFPETIEQNIGRQDHHKNNVGNCNEHDRACIPFVRDLPYNNLFRGFSLDLDHLELNDMPKLLRIDQQKEKTRRLSQFYAQQDTPFRPLATRAAEIDNHAFAFRRNQLQFRDIQHPGFQPQKTQQRDLEVVQSKSAQAKTETRRPQTRSVTRTPTRTPYHSITSP